MSVLVAVVVGLGSGLVGTLGAALLTIRHERESEIRSRMVVAAEEYMARVEPVVLAVQDVLDALDVSERDDEVVARSIDQLSELRQSWLLALLRVRLLFGTDSRAWACATRADTALEELLDAFQEWRDDPKRRGLRPSNFTYKHLVTRPLGGAWLDEVDEFATAARADILSGRGSRWLGRAIRWMWSREDARAAAASDREARTR